LRGEHDDAFARQHRQARGAQPRGDVIHEAQAHPFRAAADLERQDERGLRVRRLRRRGAGSGARTVAVADDNEDEHGDDEQRGGHGEHVAHAASRRAARHVFGRRFDDLGFRDGRRQVFRGSRRCRILRRDGRCGRFRFLGCGRDPVIAEAHDGAHEMLFLAGVVEGAAHREHGLREQAVADFGAAPDCGDQFVAANGAVAVFDEVDDRVERARRHRDECAAAPIRGAREPAGNRRIGNCGSSGRYACCAGSKSTAARPDYRHMTPAHRVVQSA
jgi:hypothetical protein